MNKMLFLIAMVGVLFISNARAALYGLDPIPKDAKTQGPSLTVDNVPPIMSQDTLGICFAFAASTILTAENCRQLKQDCTHITDDKIFSPVALTRYSSLDKDANVGAAKGFSIGGNSANVIQEVAYNTGQAPAESCVSLDKILSKVGGAKEATEMQDALWNRLKGYYEKYHKIAIECPTCASQQWAAGKDKEDVDENFNITKSNDEVLKAFAQDTYGQFLEQIFMPKECLRLSKAIQFEAMNKVEVQIYPRKDKNGKIQGDYNGSIQHIKEALNDKRVLALGNICLDKTVSKNCQNMHELVITGYRKVCNSANKCYDAIKVANSWGQSWQDQNSDGWLDAKELLDRTSYEEATLTWLSDRK